MLKTRIKELGLKKGLLLKDIEQQADLAPGTIKKWDKHSPTIRKLAPVARVLGVTVDELLREPEPTPEEQAKRDLAERLGCPVEALEKLDPSDLDTLLRAKPRTEAV